MPPSQTTTRAAHTPAASRPAPDRTSRVPVVTDVSRPIEVVEATMSCRALEELFRPEQVESVAVRDGADHSRVGLIARERCLAAMSGELGYGRALLFRKPVSDLTDWAPSFVDPWWTIPDALRLAMARPRRQRYDDLLVRSQVWGCVTVASLVEHLSGELGARADHDALTGTRDRQAWLAALAAQVSAQPDHARHVVVVVVAVDGIAATNAAYGSRVGDAVIARVAEHLRGEYVERAALGRLSGTQLALFAPLAGADELPAALARAEQVAFALQTAAQAAVRRLVHDGVVPDGSVGLRVGFALTPHGADGDALVSRALARLSPIATR